MCDEFEMIGGSTNVALKTPRKSDQPVLWIVAGPNGSGKSSFYNRTDIEGWGGSIWIINPDLLTQTIIEREGTRTDAANLAAVQRIQLWLEASLETYQTIGVETVLSSPKYRALVEKAKLRGFVVKMIYVTLQSAALQIDRVRWRVRDGGHDVPEDKIIDRRRRSFDELAWFARHVDECAIFDNSTGEPTLIAHVFGNRFVHIGDLPDDLMPVLRLEEFDLVDLRRR